MVCSVDGCASHGSFLELSPAKAIGVVWGRRSVEAIIQVPEKWEWWNLGVDK